MPVFQKDKASILFVHIPKAGGTAIEHFFRRHGWKVSLFDGGEDSPTINSVSWCSPQHFHFEILRTILNVRRFNYCFAIVREPLARIKSEVRWRKQYFDPRINSEDWVRGALDAYVQNPFVHDNHIRPQSEFVFDELEIFPFESGIEDIILQVSKRLPEHFASEPSQITRIMTTDADKTETELSSDLLERIKQFYKRDYEQFDFWLAAR